MTDTSKAQDRTAPMPQTKAVQPQSPARQALAIYLRNPAGILGMLLLLAVIAMTVLGPWVYPVDPFDLVWRPLSPPGEMGAPPLGTDGLGRDVLAGIIHGGRATLAVGLAAAVLTVLIGVTIGALAGYFGGWVDDVLMRVTELFQVLPPLIFAMVIVALFTPTLATIAIAIGVVSWPAVARLARSEYMRLKELEYVKAARVCSARDSRIIWSIILPNAAPPLIILATLTVGLAILFEAGLSFLGLGDANIMSWGLIIGNNRDYILDAWWPVTLPGIAIFVTVLAVSLIGDGLNDALNPRLRGR
jgi:peptide/nickel transport system permease protein